MVNSTRRKYLPIFVDSARTRLKRAVEMVAAENASLAAEMHALAGEAALLGLTEVVARARTVEGAAKRWRETGEVDARNACAESLGVLTTTIDDLAAQS